MNKLTKVGCSALCGSLAAISAANAGDLTVTGGADMTWTSLSDQVTGNPLGVGSNFVLKGDGELDNGWTVALAINHDNKGVYSTTTIDLGLGSLGSINFNQGNSGNGIDSFDDKMPTAWEEAWGAVLSTGVKLVSGVGPSQNIQYTFPTVVGSTLKVAYAPSVGSTDVNDKAVGGVSHTAATGRGVDITLNINPSFGTEVLSGLNLFGGASEIEQYDPSIADNKYEGTVGYTYSLGPVSIGGQTSAQYTGETDGQQTNVYKTTAFGVAFNINDNLSASYGTMESRKAGHTHSSMYTNGDLITVKSVQAAYTMGGASVRLAHVTADNTYFSTAAGADVQAMIVSLGLAF
jgi:hypothetical protein